MTPGRPLVIGHRGASGYRPEHTSAAYELAFAQGADAVEPDLVLSGDGVLVVRHENEISGTTDVGDRPEFASRRCTKTVDGVEVTGWFTEDFAWEELRTLRARERRPAIRPGNAEFDDRFGLLSFPDLLGLVERESARSGRRLGVVAELKHAAYFASRGMSLTEAYRRDLARHGWAGREPRLVTESFEPEPLRELSAGGDGGRLVRLLEDEAEVERLDDRQLQRMAQDVDGISLERPIVLASAARPDGIVARAHAAGLEVFCWTLRPENRYLTPPFRTPGSDAAWGEWRAEWRRILDARVDGVFVDHPDLMASLLAPPAEVNRR
jgi:glycerophosphoryl diester phosphodiesterase